jgi:hypothetical protein
MTTRTIEIHLSEHAVQRFHERVRPGLDRIAAEDALARLALHGTIDTEPPDWLARHQRQHAACYLVAGDVVLPLDPCRRDPAVLVALTCLARGGLSEPARQRRNLRRRRRASRIATHA